MGSREHKIRGALRMGCLTVMAVGWVTTAMAGPAPADEQAKDAASPCATDGPAAGAWKEVDGELTIRFDDRHYAVVQDGHLSQIAPVVACQDDRVEICSFGHPRTLELTLDGGRLDLHDSADDKHHTFRRLDTVPKVFDLEPFEIPKAGSQPLTDAQIKAIRKELVDRRERDQGIRKPPFDWKKMGAIDRDNTAYLKELVQRIGWIDPARFGDKAASGAFLIVQHSGDLSLMLGALPHLKAQGLLQDYALLYDRIQIYQGLPQRFGSQIGQANDGTKGLLPIETLEGIDALRTKMDLEPLDQYLTRFDLKERRVLHCP